MSVFSFCIYNMYARMRVHETKFNFRSLLVSAYQ